MSKKLNLNSVISKGTYKGKTVEQLIGLKRSEIIEMVKDGYVFEEEVYEKARYKHYVREVSCSNEIVQHQVDNKVYAKDTEKLHKILKGLETINNEPTSEEETQVNNENELYND